MEQAIKKAIEGGWDHKDMLVHLPQEYMGDLNCVIWCDPKFWQALGKALGWFQCPLRHHPHSRECEESISKACVFMEQLMQGKDAESFFNELIK